MAEQIQINALIRPELDTGGIVKKVSSIQSLLKKVNLPPSLQKEFDGLFTDFNSSIEKINGQFSKGFETKGAIKSLDSMSAEMRGTVEKIAQAWQQVSSRGDLIKLPPDQDKKLKQINTEIQQLRTKINQVNPSALEQVTQAIDQLRGKAGQKTGSEAMELINQGEAQQAINLLDIIIAKREKMSLTAAESKAGDTFRADTLALTQMRDALLSAEAETKDLVTQLEQLDADGAKILTQAMDDLGNEIKQTETDANSLNQGLEKTEGSMRGAAQGAHQMSGEMDQIKSRIQYFFSLANAVQLVRRALRQTFEAAKELDAAMTETAVVTDFSVDDMWGMLPQYTKTAQKLGATTQGVYETLTLFYQQGLNTNEAMALGTETLKMARIAGMDYEEATSKMTAALRGFNMELNEMSAQKVNDVYSELAAITAADTDQIATAMTKTASIANSANMEFETTAAFLSQIIETTQESAETAGTAMKTVIARFTELKKDPSLIGEVDGEMVDANKIETALNSIGVALRDNLTGQFRDLDDVFLDIAQKWEGLDTNTQRYIATIAAGSRQQSRFIAMMSDYERTMELVEAANNSAGSSQAQFDKTLESMEAKLNQLKNTWQEFTLGLMDSSLLKGGIEALNVLISVINKMTDLPGILGGTSKALLSFFILFTGKKLFNVAQQVIFSSMKSFQTGGEVAAISWRQGFSKEFSKTGVFLKGLFGKIFAKTIIPTPTLDTTTINLAKKEIRELEYEIDRLSEAQTYNQFVEAAGLEVDQATLVTQEQIEDVEARRALLLQTQANFKKASVAQQAAFNAAVANGVSVEQASVLLTKEATEEEIKNVAARFLGEEATEEETEALAKKIVAQQLENSTTQLSLLAKAKNLAILLFSTNAEKRNAAAKLLNIGATKGATAAQTGFNAALLACPIGWIVAGIGLLIGALVALVAVADYFSLDKQMERAEEGVERATQAVEDAKNAYEELKQTIEDYDEAQKAIDGLEQGTLDFKQAVYEANLEVLRLMELFPSLKEVGNIVNQNGRLIITDQGKEAMERASFQQVSNALTTLTSSQLVSLNTRKESAYLEMGQRTPIINRDDSTMGSLAGAEIGRRMAEIDIDRYHDLQQESLLKFDDFWNNLENNVNLKDLTVDKKQGYSRELSSVDKILYSLEGYRGEQELNPNLSAYELEIAKYLEKLEPEELTQFTTELESVKDLGADFNLLRDDLGITTNQFLELTDEMIEFKKSIDEIELQKIRHIAEGLKYEADEELSNSVASDAIAQMFAEKNKEKFELTDDKLNDWAFWSTSEVDKIDSKAEKEKLAEELAAEGYIENIDLIGLSNEESAKRLYSAITGKAMEDIDLSLTDLETEIAKFNFNRKNTREAAKEMNEFYDAIEKSGYKEEMETIIASGFELSDEQIKQISEGNINRVINSIKSAYAQEYGDLDKRTEALGFQQTIAQSESSMSSSNTALAQLGKDGKLEDPSALLGPLAQVEGLYDNLGTAAEEWNVISQQGILAQMDYLTDLSQAQYHQKEEAIAAARAQREEIEQNLQGLQNHIERLKNQEPSDQNAKLIQYYEKQLKELQETAEKTLKGTDWVLDIKVTDNFEEIQNQIDGVISSFDKISEAASVLSENFEVSADDGKKLAEVFPGILKNATVTADGQIQLDEDVRNSAIEKAETMITSNAEAEKNIIRQEMAKLDAFIDAKSTELAVVEGVLESENQANAAALLVDLTNEGSFFKEVEKIEQDELANNKAKLETEGQNEVEYGKYRTEVNKDAYEKLEKIYQEDVQHTINANTKKGGTIVGFFKGVVAAAKAAFSKDATKESVYNAFYSQFYGSGYDVGGITSVDPDTVGEGIDPDRLKESFNPVYREDGGLDYIATLDDYYQRGSAEIEKAKSQLASYEDALVLIDAQAKQGIDDLKNPGKDGSSGKSGKDEEPWKYEREYDENIKSKLKAAENEKQRLESELEGLINDENATTEDIIKKKLEIADAAKKQLALLQEQNKLDVAEAKRLQNEHLEWSNLYSIGDNGEITWDEQAINALGLSPEQGKIFDEWSKALTTAVENAAASTNDIVDKANEISEIIGTIYNEYDYLYNLELQLSQLAEEREKLEQEYNNLIEDGIKTIKPLVSNLQKQYANLEQSKIAAQDKVTLANLKMTAFLGREENKNYQKYLTKDENTGRYGVNVQEMEKLAASGISEAYDPVAQFIEDFIALQDDSIKAEEELLELEQERVDLIRDSKEAAAELENTYYDAIIEYMDRQIEETEELYSSIDDSNSRLLESIRENLELQRQERQNAETESDINDMRNRLAFLQMDTSGANQNEILNLQKQIGEKEQDYTDTLIDQKIDELERQNDIAAEQRERQIAILDYNHKQAQLNGDYLNKVKTAIENETNGLPGIVGEINTGNDAFDSMFPKDKTMSGIISENLKYSDGKMPTTAELDKQTTGILQLIAQATAGIEEARKDMGASDARTALRIAEGLDSADDLTLYQFLMYDIDNDGVLTKEDAEAILKGSVGLKAYATGGLADYTGPAWLDGTKSRPELVLNQKDTQNFLQLKDILASFMSNNSSLQNSAENRGDNYYEIHLNVEKITSDYDVEQLANKVKLIIAEDANSRGVNSIYRRR